jgi:hypothetical protein
MRTLGGSEHSGDEWMEGLPVILMSNGLFVAFAVVRESLSKILANE